MLCASGQVDLNSATAPQLVAAFGLDAAVAQRVVTFAPYLQTRDLLVVEGIGRDRLQAIVASGLACTVPTSTPPAAPDACIDARVDLQSATAAQISNKLKITKVRADNIVAARPFASLSHVTPERVPGLGKGMAEAVRAVSCLTPQPVRTATASFRWAYRDTSTTVRRGRAALTMPPATLDVVGAWLSVTDAQALTAKDGQTADFHVHGPWADGSQSVQVTLPVPARGGELGTAFTPVLVHGITGPDGPDLAVHSGTALTASTAADGTATLTTAMTSLSLVQIVFWGVQLLPDTAVEKMTDWATKEGLRYFTGTSGEQPNCDGPEPNQMQVRTAGSALQVQDRLGRAPLLWCNLVQSSNDTGETVRWKLVNNTGAVLSINTQLSEAEVVDTDVSGDILVDLAYGIHNGGRRIQVDLPPGGGAVMETTPNVDEQVIGVATNEFMMLPTFLTSKVGLLAGGKATEAYTKLWSILNSCGYTVSTSLLSNKSALNCALTASTEYLLDEIIGLTLIVIEAVIKVADTLVVEFGGPWQVQLKNYPAPAPVPPTQDTDSSVPPTTSPPAPGTARTRILKMANSRVTYLLDRDGVAHHIPDTGTYVCNAVVYPAQWNVTAEQLEQIVVGGVGTDATCPSAARRSLTSNSAAGFLLRQADGDAYIVNSSGRKEFVFGYGSFDCFAQNALVWDLVTDAELSGVPNVPSSAGRMCTPL